MIFFLKYGSIWEICLFRWPFLAALSGLDERYPVVLEPHDLFYLLIENVG